MISNSTKLHAMLCKSQYTGSIYHLWWESKHHFIRLVHIILELKYPFPPNWRVYFQLECEFSRKKLTQIKNCRSWILVIVELSKVTLWFRAEPKFIKFISTTASRLSRFNAVHQHIVGQWELEQDTINFNVAAHPGSRLASHSRAPICAKYMSFFFKCRKS